MASDTEAVGGLPRIGVCDSRVPAPKAERRERREGILILTVDASDKDIMLDSLQYKRIVD